MCPDIVPLKGEVSQVARGAEKNEKTCVCKEAILASIDDSD